MLKCRAFVNNGIGISATVITKSGLGTVNAALSVVIGVILGEAVSERKNYLNVCKSAITFNLAFTRLGTCSRLDNYCIGVAVRSLLYLAVTVTALIPVSILVVSDILFIVLMLVCGGDKLGLNVTASTSVCHLTLSSTSRSLGNLTLAKAMISLSLYGLAYRADLPVAILIGCPAIREGVLSLGSRLGLCVTALARVGDLTLLVTGSNLGYYTIIELMLGLVLLVAALTFAPVHLIIEFVEAVAMLVTEVTEERIVLDLIFMNLTVKGKSYNISLTTLAVTGGKVDLITQMDIIVGKSLLITAVFANEFDCNVAVLAVVGVAVRSFIAVPIKISYVLVANGSGVIVIV